ncbi:MAG TPA: LAGLIDADG family homing endonuclease [Candidatus Nanoarchaeia archaeon]|nr:LAGLIDADG family homing endonuclease [Candidatus Nanoarchaeia archaeon]
MIIEGGQFPEKPEVHTDHWTGTRQIYKVRYSLHSVSSEQINIWDLGDKINVKVNQSFIDLINRLIKLQFKNKKNIHQRLNRTYKIPFNVFKDRLKRGYRYFVDLEILLTLCDLLNIPKDRLQKEIIAYKARRGHNYIENPKLPIKITPLFDMLIAHHIGDGYMVQIQGRKIYFGYRQYNEKYRMLYLKKIEAIFGKLRYKIDYFHKEGSTNIYFPVSVSGLMFKVYDLKPEDFMSETARIPEPIFQKNWKHQLAFLLGIIIDEGHVDSSLIVIGMKNRLFIEDLNRLCGELQYTSCVRERKDGMTSLYILSNSLPKFFRDYQTLLSEYPQVDLGYKGEKIKEFISRIFKPKLYLKGNKTNILKELSSRELTVNEIATSLNMTRQGARYLVKELTKESKIEVKSIVKFGNCKYGLKVLNCS